MGAVGVVCGDKESLAVVVFADRAEIFTPAHFPVVEIHEGVGLADHHRFCVDERLHELIKFVREIGMFAYDIVPACADDFDFSPHDGHYFMVRRDWFQSGVHILILSRRVRPVNTRGREGNLLPIFQV